MWKRGQVSLRSVQWQSGKQWLGGVRLTRHSAGAAQLEIHAFFGFKISRQLCRVSERVILSSKMALVSFTLTLCINPMLVFTCGPTPQRTTLTKWVRFVVFLRTTIAFPCICFGCSIPCLFPLSRASCHGRIGNGIGLSISVYCVEPITPYVRCSSLRPLGTSLTQYMGESRQGAEGA